MVLVTWRAALRNMHNGQVREPEEAIHGASLRALDYLDALTEKYRDHPLEDQRQLVRMLAPARAEIHAAIGDSLKRPMDERQPIT